MNLCCRNPEEQSALKFFANAARGTENVLADELESLSCQQVKCRSGGVEFTGPWQEGWRVCLHSRVAQRVQVEVGQFAAAGPEALYRGVIKLDWQPFLTSQQTFAVSSYCRSSVITHSGYAALICKDAVVDQIRQIEKARPDVDRTDPDVKIFLHLFRDRATVYLDLAGNALFQRGYREATGPAPLKETLAAAMLRLAEWDCETPLLDPMCGAGTIPIEAALWAGNIAPGIWRQKFGFERWACFDADAAASMHELRSEARAKAHRQLPRIRGADSDAAVLKIAQNNCRNAGVRLQLRQRQIQDLQATTERGFIVTNPPYGERMGMERTFLREMSAAFCRLHGWRVCILAGSEDIEREMSVTPWRRHRLHNGDIPCQFLVYEIP